MSNLMFSDVSEIKTTSRMEAWWLQTVKKYTVKHIVRSAPKPSMLGGIKYHTLWVLQAPDDAEHAESRPH